MSWTRNFFIGLGAGIAVTVVVLNTWGGHLAQQEVALAQPRLLRPLLSYCTPGLPKSSAGLPSPWLPTTLSPASHSWVLQPLSGAPITLADLKGKVVFLNFWSTSCVPCVAEMPGIEALRSSLKGSQVVFLAVALGNEQSVRRFLHQIPLPLPFYVAKTKPPKELQPSGFPTTFIINREGAVVFREVGGLNWNDDRVRTYMRGLAGH